jgi:hypothetical protein
MNWWKESGPGLEDSGTVLKRDAVTWDIKFD